MTQGLPESGHEREIMLRALRAYSDNREAPYLTAGCPFAVDLSDGTRGCGEECIELIAHLGAPHPVDDIPLGDGTGLRVSRRRRPRPRRGPDKASRPFDAAEIYMRDSSSRDIELWSPVSLLYELRQEMGEPPPDDETDAKVRKSKIHRIVAILEERGIGFDAHLRETFAGAQGVLIGVLTVLGSSLDLDESFRDTRIAEVGRRWKALLDVGDTVQSDQISPLDMARVFAEQVPRTVEWALSADLDELIDWWPTDGEAPLAGPNVMNKLTDHDRWVTDRFLATYLDHWATSSLHAEWEWIHGNRESPIPLAAMRARKIDPDRLAAQIADMAVTDRTKRSSAVAMGQYQDLASGLIREGRRQAAVGVFEGVLAVEPEDPQAHNNRGFCLLVDDAAAALNSLERAAELGYEPIVINVANRVVALARLNRLAAADDLAERGFIEATVADPVPASLSDPKSIEEEPSITRSTMWRSISQSLAFR